LAQGIYPGSDAQFGCYWTQASFSVWSALTSNSRIGIRGSNTHTSRDDPFLVMKGQARDAGQAGNDATVKAKSLMDDCILQCHCMSKGSLSSFIKYARDTVAFPTFPTTSVQMGPASRSPAQLLVAKV